MKKGFFLLFFFCAFFQVFAQNYGDYWHGIERELRYHPDGEDFVIVNGNRKFTRALYGTNTAFRVETSDVPEFALFMPRMGGNLQFGLSSERTKKEIHLNDAAHIEARYRPGCRIYTIEDPILQGGKIVMTVLAMADADGFLIKTELTGIPADVRLMWMFGGASDHRMSRNGDMNADPENVFYLLPEYCVSNKYTINGNRFGLEYGDNKRLQGIFPNPVFVSDLRRTIPGSGFDPAKDPVEYPIITGAIQKNETHYFAIYNPETGPALSYSDLSTAFDKAEIFRQSIAGRIKINTPDPFLNTVGGALAIAGDAIWENPVYQHGAIGWRVQLPGWRGAYTGDFLGWHDRARTHFDAYGAAQFTNEPSLPVIMDTTLNLARSAKVYGTPMYSSGYIGRYPNSSPERNGQMNHYDMNIVYIDALLWHLNWTGDLEYAEKMWPVLERHLAWEKRNYDPEDDGLYDAYCCIWASDALQYNSGAVTHSSAYNYRANKMAAEIAEKIGKDPVPYRQEAEKILEAMNKTLWMPERGWWAEFKEWGGHERLHPNAAVWTFYHTVDSEAGDPLQYWQAGQYINNEIPHIPVRAKNYDDGQSYVVSTTNWMPYFWSINNVAIAESVHTALALWQSGHSEPAFNLLKGQILDVMYMGGSPGNTGQVSFYDSARGETYRDFADPTGVLSRAVVQGLFGIYPDLMNDRVEIRPGLPAEWDYASFSTPDIEFDFKRNGQTDTYRIIQRFQKQGDIILKIPALSDQVKQVTLNGRKVTGEYLEESVGLPLFKVDGGKSEQITIAIEWGNDPIENAQQSLVVKNGEEIRIDLPKNQRLIWPGDPQSILRDVKDISDHSLTAKIQAVAGNRTLFLYVQQGEAVWHMPVYLNVLPDEPETIWSFTEPKIGMNFEPVDISGIWNDRLVQIFRNKYLSPRSPNTTLQIPTQGIGEWCVPAMTADINDEGVRSQTRDGIFTALGIPFASETDSTKNNIVYTSLWDNYPTSIDIPLQGKASLAYLLMAGSTNHMQCHMVNGTVTAYYKDGSSDQLKLINPETWAPIEQDFFFDDYAFQTKGKRPYRVQLSTGLVSRSLGDELGLKGAQDRRIPGGAATILDLPLDPSKELDKLTLETESLEVVIGLMGVTLVR